MSALNLPPLPPVGGEITGRNVVDVLASQHRALLALADSASSAVELEVLIAELSRHLSAEEQYFYPAVRAAVPDGERLIDLALADDHALLVALTDRKVPDLGPHCRSELPTLLAQMAPVEDLIRIGNRVETAAEAAPTRPHPGTPSRPPWNKVVDPAVAMFDKIRDVAARRTTYMKDL